MARIEPVKTFWKTIKAISVAEIAAESRKPFALAVVGPPEARLRVLERLFPGMTPEDVVQDRSLVRTFDSLDPATGFPADSAAFDFVLHAGCGRADAPAGTPVYSLEELGGWDRMVEHMLDERPELALSLARRLPGVRPAVAQRVIAETALANAEYAMMSALPGVVPIVGPILSIASMSDLLMLTKNQAMMLYRIAAAYDLPLDARARAADLAPLLANAFSWRALARELVAVVPGGVGLVLRGSIACAGTVAVGKGLQKLYETGRRPTRSQIAQFYREALEGARETASGIARRLLGRPRKSLPR